MKNLKNTIFLLITLSLFFFTSCTSSDDESNNNEPTSFSSNTIETKTYGATIEWTESTDFDGDLVTYTIVLEGKEVASGVNALTHSFTDLEPETIYNGNIEAKDGNGGVTKADFFFTTEPILFIKWRDFIEGDGHSFVAFFEVPEKSGASSYAVEVKEYSLNTSPATIGRSYSWKPEDDLPTGNNVGTGSSGLTEFSSGVYHANTHVSGAHVTNAAAVSQLVFYYGAITGSAELTIRYK
ncbi:hypothetical protein [uncultured Algibacter sp.]|uniref:fibronectin type III domain-containing protein n=1 Tax=uncultured Algibacter sp. TaxID=298659 RepID=UPI00260E724D|nr:hypothetical protein [uncultured Algibacter sp.]